MRGVCALNLEAMSLMKGGLPLGGPTALQAEQALLPLGTGSASSGPAMAQPVGGSGAADGAGAMGQQAQRRLGEQLEGKLLQQRPVVGGTAGGWAIGTGPQGPAVAFTAAAFTAAGTAPAGAAVAVTSNNDSSSARVYKMPAPERPRPLVSLAPTQPVPPMPQLPASVARAAERHSTAGARPSTAVPAMQPVPCSLPSNLPPHVAAAAGGRRAAAPSPRPATAPPRRQQAAAAAAGTQQKRGQQQQQQVSRRSLAGQAREGAGLGREQPLVVRGAVGTPAGQRK